MPVARALRARGIEVDVGSGERRLPRELERANRLGVRYAVIVGDSELADGGAIIREMASGSQSTVPLAGLAEAMVARAEAAPGDMA
jgi:histidyl-tRNA synthetase